MVTPGPGTQARREHGIRGFLAVSTHKDQSAPPRGRRAFPVAASLLTAILLPISAGIASSAAGAAEGPGVPAPALAAFSTSPLGFVANAGQVDPRVRYYSRGPGYGVYFTPDEAVVGFARSNPPSQDQASRGVALALRFLEANSGVEPQGQRAGAAKVNFLTGSDPAKWRTGLATYQEIVYPELWPGIDLVFRQEHGRLKYEFVLQPGTRVQAIRLAYRGAEGLSLDASGNLLISTALGKLTDERPTSYQVIAGRRVPVESRFALATQTSNPPAYGFAVGAGYDPGYPLIIDPGLAYSVLLGGTATDIAHAIAVDGDGNAYVTGQTNSTEASFPTTVGAYQGLLGRNAGAATVDAFVAKFDPAGALLWATYLGGSGTDLGRGIAVDGLGRAYVTGETSSANFPTTPGAFQIVIGKTGSSDAFVTKLSADGSSLVYSTYLGGSQNDVAYGIAIACLTADPADCNAFVTGQTFSTANFPAKSLKSGNKGVADGFVAKLAVDGSGLVYSVYIGGSSNDAGRGIAVDGFGNAYITGQTDSSNFPVAAPAPFLPYDSVFNGATDAFVAKLNPAGTALVYSTFLGGSGTDIGYGIAVDAAGNAYVTGQTSSSNFPTGALVPALPYDSLFNGGTDAFVAKLNPSGSALVYSTFLGGGGTDIGYGIAVDGAGNAYITGQTDSTNFPAPPGAFDFDVACNSGNVDAFVASLKPDGSGLHYAGCLGSSAGIDIGRGIDIDAFGNAHIAGQTASSDFPNTGVSGYKGATDAFVLKLRASTTTTITSHTPDPSVVGQEILVSFKVEVNPPGSVTPDGMVTVSDGTASCTGTLDGAGSGSCQLTPTSAETKTLMATYAGNSNFGGSTSAGVTHMVTPRTTTTTLSLSSITVVVGQGSTVTVTVTDVAAGTKFTPAGTITLGSSVASDTFSGTCTLAQGANLVGIATCSITVKPAEASTHTISASYTPSTSPSVHLASGPASASLTVFTRTTTTTLSLSPSTVVVGEPSTAAVTVTDTQAEGTKFFPAGTVAVSSSEGTDGFSGGPCVLAVTATPGVSSCAVTVTPAQASTHIISASFTPSTSPSVHLASGPTTAGLTVNTRATTTTVELTPGAVVVGQVSTLKVTVTDVEAVGTKFTPSGTITVGSSVASDAFSGAPCMLAATATPGVSNCAVTVTPAQASTHTISASFTPSPSPNVHTASGPTSAQLTVNTRATTIAQSLTPSTVVVGQASTVKVTVTDTEAAGTKFTPAGTVTVGSSVGSDAFSGTCTLAQGGNPIGTAVCSVTVTPAQASTHVISASFTPSISPSVHTASGPTTAGLTVNTRSTTTTLSFAPDPVVAGFGSLVTVTVTDTQAEGAKFFPTGTLTVSSSVATDALSRVPCVLAATATPGVSACAVTVTLSAAGLQAVGFHTVTAGFAVTLVHSASSGADGFTVISAPTVTNTDRKLSGNAVLSNPLIRDSAVNCGSQQVNIFGTNFQSPTDQPLVVLFSGTGITAEEVGFQSAAQITAIVKVAGDATLVARTVTVINSDGGTATGVIGGGGTGGYVDVANGTCPSGGLGAPKASTSTPPPQPTISGVSPDSKGPRGSTVTIGGSNFGSTAGDNAVKFSGVQVPSTDVTLAGGGVQVKVPTNAPIGLDTVTITVLSTGQVSSGVAFTVTNPQITSVSPKTALQGDSITLGLIGSQFASGATVTLSPATGITVSLANVPDATHIQVPLTIAADAPAGLRDVTVTNLDGGAFTLAGAFEVKQPQAVSLELSLASPADVSSFLPTVDAVSVTLDSTGKCTAKTVTPHAVTLQALFTPTLQAPTPPASVAFTINSSTTSAWPGTASNENCELGATPAKDFAIGVADPTWGTSQVVTVTGAGTYATTLFSYDFGASTTVTMTATVTVNGTPQTVTRTLTLPVDADGDGLPDAYELNAALNANAAGINVLNAALQDQDGNGIPDGEDRFAKDGLSNFEKYRGVYLVGPMTSGPMNSHTRLGAGRRHLFIRGSGFGNDPLILANPGMCGTNIPKATAQIVAGATTIPVGTTAGFPPAGIALLGGSGRFRYTGTTATSFTGVTGVTQTWSFGTSIFPATAAPVRATHVDGPPDLQILAGATTIPVTSTAGFPLSGTASLGDTNSFGYTGTTATSFTGVTGVDQTWAVGTSIFTDSPTTEETCPPFELVADLAGVDPFAKVGVQVHDVSASFTVSTQFPRQSLADPTQALLDVATVYYDAVNCIGGGSCNHTLKTGVRQWQFASLGFSAFGSAGAYGLDVRVGKRAVDGYFRDKPYTKVSGTLGLDPIPPSADKNDSGTLDKQETACGGVPCGDLYRGGLSSDPVVVFSGARSAMDINGDGCVELPFQSDPTALAACVPTAASADFPQATKRQVVRFLSTHELSHAVGINTHTTVVTDIVYQYSVDWARNEFSQAAGDLVQIHNKGLQ